MGKSGRIKQVFVNGFEVLKVFWRFTVRFNNTDDTTKVEVKGEW